MKLYIGGFAQGKLEYVLEQYGLKNFKDKKDNGEEDDNLVYINGDQIETLNDLKGKQILNHYHLLAKKQLADGRNPEEFLEAMQKVFPDLIIISDEVGNGVVPMDAFEREYREKTGRMLCKIAQNAETVERIFCGIGQRIK